MDTVFHRIMIAHSFFSLPMQWWPWCGFPPQDCLWTAALFQVLVRVGLHWLSGCTQAGSFLLGAHMRSRKSSTTECVCAPRGKLPACAAVHGETQRNQARAPGRKLPAHAALFRGAHTWLHCFSGCAHGRSCTSRWLSSEYCIIVTPQFFWEGKRIKSAMFMWRNKVCIQVLCKWIVLGKSTGNLG